MTQHLVLASTSPRRIELLRNAGFQLTLLPPDIVEIIPEGWNVRQTVTSLALQKVLWAEQAWLTAHPHQPVYMVAADTVVWTERAIGKPVDRADLIRMLRELNGREHCVATGVALIEAGTSRRKVFTETTRVFFKSYDDAFIERYADTPEPYDKAGGYAIQGAFGCMIDHIEGDRNNVVGFPLATFLRAWTQFTGDAAPESV